MKIIDIKWLNEDIKEGYFKIIGTDSGLSCIAFSDYNDYKIGDIIKAALSLDEYDVMISVEKIGIWKFNNWILKPIKDDFFYKIVGVLTKIGKYESLVKVKEFTFEIDTDSIPKDIKEGTVIELKTDKITIPWKN